MKLPHDRLLLIIASTGLSILLWFLIAAEERSEIIVSVPLEYRNLPRGYEISVQDELLTEVSIWVKGSTANIKNLRPQEISAWVDLQDSSPGERIFELEVENVRVPYGFTVLRISPSRAKLRIEEVLRKVVPVTPQIEGEPPEGYAVSRVVVTPPQVEIVGPTSAVNAVKEVITDSINVSNLTGERQVKVNVGVEHNAVRLGNTRDVTVLLRASEIEDILTLRQIPVLVEGNKRVTSYHPKTVRVDVRAPKRLLTELDEEDLHAVLDLQGLKRGTYELTPNIQILSEHKENITITKVIPERIRVRIE